MKRVLIVKISSLGDVIHTLPALTDAGKAIQDIRFDWVIEEGFAEVPSWHSLVDRVIPIAIRRWRKGPIRSLFSGEVRKFWKELRQVHYDYVVDAQGLIKSAVVTRFARGSRVGLSKSSLTEPLARFAYQTTVDVDLKKHAIWRMRSIFSKALGYEVSDAEPDAGLSVDLFSQQSGKYVVFLYGTTWATKRWPSEHWIALSKQCEKMGYTVKVPWSSEVERQIVAGWAEKSPAILVLQRMSLTELAGVLSGAKAIVSVDTGLGHLAAALRVPTVSLYGPTDPKRVGTVGDNQVHLVAEMECVGCDSQHCKKSADQCANCMKKITSERVYEYLTQLLP